MSSHASTKINQKEYLKKYLSGDKVKKKKKDKKHKKEAASKVKIIDDDANTFGTEGHEIDEELLLGGDDAPQIVGEYIEERVNGAKAPKWRSIAVKEELGEEETAGAAKIKQDVSDEHERWGRKAVNIKIKDEFSPPRREHKVEQRQLTPDHSPPRRKQKQRRSGSRERNGRIVSPQRQKNDRTHSDKSRPGSSRRSRSEADSDHSPPRKGKASGSSRHRSRSADQSPARKRQEDHSPPRKHKGNKRDQSPTRGRKSSADCDQSPPRRLNKAATSDQSPPRRRRKSRDSDPSPPRRRRKSHDSDQSPPRRLNKAANTDQSPPRRRRKSRDSDPSPPRRRRKSHDSDQSPPRRRDADNRRRRNPTSPHRRRHDSSDQSPPRRRDSDQSPPRKRNLPSTSPTRIKREKRSPEQSPSRRSTVKAERAVTPPRRSRWEQNHDSDSPPPTHKPKASKTLDGKKAGLQDAQALKAETEERRRREERMFEQMSTDVSGRDAEVQVRITGRKGKRARNAQAEDPEVQRRKEEHERKKKELYDRWGKGLKQIEEHREKLEKQAYEGSKPLARYSNDEDLERHLREQERVDDPMLEYMRQKRKEQQKAQNVPTMPLYEGSFPENRFGIRPGYRWDGVDRSNGFEKKWFDAQNERRAVQDEAYKYSVEDM